MPERRALPSTELPMYTTLQPQVHPSLEAPMWQGVYSAIGLLPSDMRERLRNVDLDQAPRQGVLGYVDLTKNDQNIHIPAKSEMYQRANKGDRDALKQLAGSIAHEEYHLEHGADEGPAYDTQIALLKALRAPRRVVAASEEAKRVTGGQ